MASLPNPRTVTYEEWLEMPEVTEGIEDAEGILKPQEFPHVQVDIDKVWPD